MILLACLVECLEVGSLLIHIFCQPKKDEDFHMLGEAFCLGENG